MLNKGENIEDLFGNAFRDAEITPPSSMWDNVESSLNNSGVENLYKKTFENSTITPSKKVWNRIAYILFIRSFFQFNPKTVNVYYAAITAIVGVVCFNVFDNKTNSTQNINPIQSKEIISQTNSKVNEVTVNAEQKTQVNTVANQNNSNNTNQTIISDNKEVNPKSNDVSKANVFDFSKIKIIGKTSLCANSDADYTIEGVPVDGEIEWNLSQKDGVLKFISTRKISAAWNKSGKYFISAQITIGNSSKKVELPIQVESASIPAIKGKSKVCEGQEKQLYSIDEPVDKNIQYNWRTKSNPIDLKGNKYINIDWNKSGKDTLFVTKINDATGCISKSSMAIQIMPKPTIDFEMAPLGNNEFEFRYIGNVKKSANITWTIDGNEYNDNVIIHEHRGMDNSTIHLKIKDNNNCYNSLSKEVSFNKNILFVPRQFSITDEDGFIPQTNNELKTYKIEIFNARNEKIWESTELSNGKPSKAWDGTFKGNNLPRGKYYWRIQAVFEDGTKWKGVKQPTGEMKPSGIFILEN